MNQTSLKTLERTFNDRLQVKTGVDVKTRDPLNNADFKTEFLKTVRKQFEGEYKKIDMNNNDKENVTVKFLFKPLRF